MGTSWPTLQMRQRAQFVELLDPVGTERLHLGGAAPPTLVAYAEVNALEVNTLGVAKHNGKRLLERVPVGRPWIDFICFLVPDNREIAANVAILSPRVSGVGDVSELIFKQFQFSSNQLPDDWERFTAEWEWRTDWEAFISTLDLIS